MNSRNESATIPTNLRLLVLLEEIARVGAPVTPTTLNSLIGLPKPTVHRLFATLEAEGYVMRELDGRSYSPGYRLRRLAVNVMSSQQARSVRHAALAKLAEVIGETCNIAVPDQDSMVYLERVETQWPLRIQLPIGARVPLHCTASGKMYLSSLNTAVFERYLQNARLERKTAATIISKAALRKEIETTRARGYGQDAEEFIQDMIAIAVPVKDDQGRLLATLSFHAPTLRLTLEAACNHIPQLQQSALDLARLALHQEG